MRKYNQIQLLIQYLLGINIQNTKNIQIYDNIREKKFIIAIKNLFDL